ncbi:MAG TPA: choice-of-anchor Q domain-containing protein, partial [Acidimicrobiales bacterium]
ITGAGDNGFGGGGILNDGGQLTVTGSTLLDNAAANGLNGGGIYNNAGSVTVTSSTLTGNNTGNGSGGAVYNDGGTFTVTASTLTGNSAVDNAGGAIDNNSGTLTVTDSTINHNTAFYSADGGGIYNAGSLALSNSTLSGNAAKFGGVGGNIFTSGPATVAATIVANSAAGRDCFGTLTDDGYNLDDDSTCGFSATGDLTNTPADLDARGLEDNGGPTETIALQSTSPAIGAINDPTLCSTPDQRGVARPTPCAMGAVEVVLPAQAITSADTATTKVGSSFSFTVRTTGVPLPSITRKGKLPKHLAFVNRHDGTALISGSPTKAGTYPFTIEADFGKGKSGHVVTQAFTLTVDPAS